MTAVEKLVVGYNDSEGAKAALRWAISYAGPRGAEIRLVYVVSSAGEWELAAVQINTDPIRRQFEAQLIGKWSQPLRDAGIQHRTRLLVGRPVAELMQYARKEAAALLVVGMNTRGTMGELFFGSTAHDLARHALRPVVVVPPDWSEPSAAPSG